MGLLDSLSSPDAIFALGLLQAASPQPRRVGLGEGLLSSVMGAESVRNAREDRAQRAALQGLQMDHLRSQIAETLAQADQRKAAKEDALRKAQAADALQQRQQQFLLGGMQGGPMAGAGGPSIMAGSGQRSPEQNAQVASQAQARGFDYATAAALFGPEHAAKLMQGMNDARNFGRDKVAGTVETVIPGTNMPGTMMRDEFGRPVGAVLPKAVEMKLQDLGGSVQAVNPYALTAGQGLTKTQTPDGAASNAVAWANNALARQRFAFDQQQPRGQYDAERGVMVDPRTAQATPVTMGGTPIGPKDRPMAEAAQKQVIGARNLQDAIGGYLKELDGWSNAAMLSPDRRAKMGNVYNNMMLQAKEAYNLGVLNGPDYAILQKIVADPTNYQSAAISNEALASQAKALQLVATNIERTALAAHGKPAPQSTQVIDLFKLPGTGVAGQPAQPGVIDWNSLPGGR